MHLSPPQKETAAVAVRNQSLAARLQGELINAQVGFCSMWLLDNVLPHPDRVFTVDRTDTAQLNVMLDVKDATRDLKLAPDGLEARNDCISFESVKGGSDGGVCCVSPFFCFVPPLFLSAI